MHTLKGGDMKIVLPNEETWVLNTEDRVVEITNLRQLEAEIRDVLEDIASFKVEFMTVTPSSPIGNIEFMQAALVYNETQNFIHIEFAFTSLDEDGTPNMMYKEVVTVDEALNIFMDFFQNKKIDMNGWQKIVWYYPESKVDYEV